MSAASYIPFIVVALWILPRRPLITKIERESSRQNIYSNVLKIAGLPHLRGALLTVFFSSLLCAPLVTFIPILVKDIFSGGAGQFSIAVGAFGVGGLLGAILLLFVAVDHDRRYLISWFAGVYGFILVLVALNPWFWGLPVLLVFGGMAMSVSNISANTLIQANIPSQLRGQAVSLFMLAMRGGLAIGCLLTGMSVSLLGVTHALLLNGALAVVAQIVIGRKWVQLHPAKVI